MTVYDDAVNRILDREGGIADVGDGKGVTRFGQTPAWLAQFNLPEPTTREAAANNYLRWIELAGIAFFADERSTTVDDLADILFDIAVMSDHRKAIKALQQVLGVKVDGVPGPETVQAIGRCDRRQTARNVIAWDMEYQGGLVTINPARAKFAKGWATRMAGHVRSLS